MTKLCECGCGLPAPISTRNRPELGHVIGQPIRFISGHNGQIFPHTEEGFWRRVARSQNTDECWNWTGPVGSNGHGLLYFQGSMHAAHRLAYTFGNGPIPAGLMVRHSCDNPSCCNPRHLLVGTTQDNTADRQARQRQARGERTAGAKLKEADIPRIRERSRSGESYASISRDLGVSWNAIREVAIGRTWKHVA